ncbi:MAG: SWIM zinc finger domain-containing protein [Candidatus Izemoplasmatales bacterium]
MGLKELSGYRSLWRGYNYYIQGKVLEIEKVNDQEYNAKVRNDENTIYNIHLNVNHPRKSTCNCPHADGRSIICKHMVASYFAIFPEKAKEFIEEVERYEKEEEERVRQSIIMREERIKDIKKYVNKLTKKELKEKLLEYMIESDFFDDDDLY